MGFVPEPRTYTLEFADPNLNGLVVKAKAVSIAEFLTMTGLEETAILTTSTLTGNPPASILEKFAESIIEWNLGPDKDPLPKTAESVRAQELWVGRQMVKAWLEAISNPNHDSPETSDSGATSEDQSLDLASASANL